MDKLFTICSHGKWKHEYDPCESCGGKWVKREYKPAENETHLICNECDYVRGIVKGEIDD